MVHRVSHKKLSRNKDARAALLKNLAASLVLHEKIVTTTAKAKAMQPFVEKLVTKAKEDNISNRRYLLAKLNRESVVKKLLDVVGPTFKSRPGGYTRMVKLPARSGDSAPLAAIEFVENVSELAARKKLEIAERKKKTETKSKKPSPAKEREKKIKSTKTQKTTTSRAPRVRKTRKTAKVRGSR